MKKAEAIEVMERIAARDCSDVLGDYRRLMDAAAVAAKALRRSLGATKRAKKNAIAKRKRKKEDWHGTRRTAEAAAMRNYEKFKDPMEAAREFSYRCGEVSGDCSRCRYYDHAPFDVHCFAEWLNAETLCLERDEKEEAK